MASKLSPSSTRKNVKTGSIDTVILKKGLRLNIDNVFKVLQRTGEMWRWLAQRVLRISSSKCDDIEHRWTNDDDRLKDAIQFWLKRYVYASWRSIIFYLAYNFSTLADELLDIAEPLIDSSLTTDKISAALAMLDDQNVERILRSPVLKKVQLRRQSNSRDEYRDKLISYWRMVYHVATWEELSWHCFFNEKEKALDEVRKHFQRKLEPTLTKENLINVLADVKDWSDYGLPLHLGISDSKLNKLKKTYPDHTQCQSAIIELFLNKHPAPNWELVCCGLYQMQEYEILEVVQSKYFKGTCEMRRHLQVAMKKGKGKTSITKVVLFGAPESGKTCTKHVVMDEDPPEEYTSTPLALRPVTVFRIDATASEWKKLTRKERDLVIAKACQQQSVHELADTSQLSFQASADVKRGKTDTAASQGMQDPGGRGKDEASSLNSPPSSSSLAIGEIPKLKGIIAPSLETYDGLIACMEECSQLGDVEIVIKRVQIADCGGQEQFHHILPVFNRGTTLYIFVFRLDKELGSRPMNSYTIHGKLIGNPQPCLNTYKQFLKNCLRVVRSQKAIKDSKVSHIMAIGTHKDKEHECLTETRKDKNQELLKLLFPEFKKEIKYYRQRPSKEVIFPLNAKNPGEAEKKVAAEIRRLISAECEAEATDIPLQWHGLEALLDDLTKAHGREVITKAECFAAAKDLHFEDEAALDSALNYLDQLNLCFYYPDILPEVIFASAQVLLDKVTELVQAAHEIQDDSDSDTATLKLQDEQWQRFCDQALISTDFLAQEEFQRHYISGIFAHHDLITLFKKLLIFAHFSSREVFVPAILKELTEKELKEYRVSCSSSAASPLVLTFPKHGGPLLGVFCATVVALLSEDNAQPNQWTLDMDEDEMIPVCLHRNCVQFTVENYPGTITLIDSFKFIEVHLSEAAACKKDYPMLIKHTVVESIRKATLALHYNYSKPEVGFGCPCGTTPGFHLAKICEDSLWICSKKKEKCGPLSSCHKTWLGNRDLTPTTTQNASTSKQGEGKTCCLDIDSKPKLHELDYLEHNDKKIKVISSVAHKWDAVAIRLHFEGHEIETIERDSFHQSELACQNVLCKWLEGKAGRNPMTWRTLIVALREADFGELAHQLENATVSDKKD